MNNKAGDQWQFLYDDKELFIKIFQMWLISSVYIRGLVIW